MKQPEISVIVPVYKVEPYLRQCIDSILAQTFTDFELILVDDGSPDNCGKICDEYALEDERIIAIHGQNGGSSAARNTGLDIMQGKYVAFVDSDDYLAREYLEILHRAVISTCADIAMCKRYHFLDGEETKAFDGKIRDAYKIMNGRDASLFRYHWDFSISPMEKIFVRKLFETARFPVGKIAEDQAVIPFLIYSAKNICLIDEELYYYRIRNDSISHGTFKPNMFDNIVHMNMFIQFLDDHHESEIASEAKLLRDRTLALYTISAISNDIKEIPKGCHMNRFKALYILRKNYPDSEYSWFLSKIYPNGVRYHEYFRKLESIITKKPL